MPKKLTVVGALAAVVFGALSLFGSSSPALGNVQSFTVNNTLCLTEPVDGVVGCPATAAVAGSTAPVWQVTNLPAGSRLTLPVIYTPTDFGFNAGAVAATVGDVTAQSDILCDNVNDILAGGPLDPTGPSGGENALAPWPDDDVWHPFPFIHQGVAPAGADAYVTSIKATPGTYVPVSHDRSDLYTLWLGKSAPLYLPSLQNGNPTPLNAVIENVPAAYGTTGLRVAATYLAGNPSPPSNSFTLCLDSPQDSVAQNTQNQMPGAAGLYPRWVTYTSDVDDRDGGVSRLIDIDCIQVGGPQADADGDCLEDADDANDAAGDADGDLLTDAVEAVFGTNPAAADSDGDGADDFDEMFNFTNPDATDTDGDGSADKSDNGSDEVPGTVSVTDDTAADDNCPTDNGAQTNTDAVYTGAVPADVTAATGDTQGDLCDTDDDNDGMVDVAELNLFILAPADSSGFCKSSNAGGAVSQPSLPLDGDTDNDRGLDGRECQFNSNPQNVASTMPPQPQDDLGPGAASDPAGSDSTEAFFRTDSIATGVGSQNDNPDGDGLNGGPADGDSDNDKLNDGPEVKRYGTNPTNADTDLDSCSDGREAATVNGDRSVSAIDLGLVAAVFGSYPGSDLNKVNRDFDRNGSISAIDLGQVASLFGNCVAATGLNVVKDDDGSAP